MPRAQEDVAAGSEEEMPGGGEAGRARGRAEENFP